MVQLIVKICFLIQVFQNYFAQNLLKAFGNLPSMQKSSLNCGVRYFILLKKDI